MVSAIDEVILAHQTRTAASGTINAASTVVKKIALLHTNQNLAVPNHGKGKMESVTEWEIVANLIPIVHSVGNVVLMDAKSIAKVC